MMYVNDKEGIQQTKRRGSVIVMPIIILLFLFYIVPSLQLEIKFYCVLGIGILFTGIYSLFTGEQFGIKILLGTIVLSFLFYLLGDAINLNDIIGKLYNYFMIFLPAIIFSWVAKKCNWKQKKFLFVLAIVVYVFVLLNTYQELLVNENATRSLEQIVEMTEMNVGTYDFVYASGALTVFIVISIIEVNAKWKKIGLLCLCLGMVYFMFMAQYTIAVLGIVIACLSIPLFKEKRVVVRIFYFVLMALVVWFLPVAFEYIAQHITSKQMALRLMELVAFLEGTESMGYNLGGRLGLYGKAIQAFLEHPILGNRVLNFDSHSTILAVFARLGLSGGVILIWILRKMKKKTANELKIYDDKKRHSPVFVYYMVMAFTNPIHAAFSTALMVWFIIPLGLELILKEKKKNVTLEN